MTGPSSEQRLAMENYLGRVQALVIEQDWLTPEDFAEVWNLVEHGEPAEGLCTLAWIIAGRGQQVSREVVDAIRRHTEGLVGPDDLPASLDELAL